MQRPETRWLAALAVAVSISFAQPPAAHAQAQQPAVSRQTVRRMPLKQDSVRLAVIGDSGTGDRPQFELSAEMVRSRSVFPFDFVLMLGDNIYGRQRPIDFKRKFEDPYQALLSSGVKFFAALGNHDNPNSR